ncbi:MAG: DUF1592 domain-containing protein, partial [Nannocystaceae bacterium]|nr:DUF1592 domain-containing protein [Nannocystaceae bacterium]
MMRCQWSFAVSCAAALGLGGCYGGLSDNAAEGVAEDGGGSAEDGGDGGDDDGESDGADDGGPPTVECDGEVLDPGPNMARRLTVREYTNTVQALLSVDIRSEAIDALPGELRADGFTNSSSGLITTLPHIEGYDELAELAVSRIPNLATFAGQYTDCDQFTDVCKRQFVEKLGLRAFRRPVSQDEADLLVRVFDIAEAEGQGFDVGAGLVIETMMQSPPFLYRLEDETTGSGARALTGYEMATRLSYLLWAGPPDDILLAAAADDTLVDDEEIQAQVDRMLDLPEARDASIGFLSDWLNLPRLANLPRDPERFPTWSLAIAAAMQQETIQFFTSIAWDQERALSDLFIAQETWLTPELADFYGIPGGAPGFGQVDVTDLPERGGLLTQGSLLTIGGDNASMVARGLFVFEHVLCSHPVSPPDGIDTTPPPVEAGKPQRYYAEERLANEACQGCHLQFEPLAFGL